GYFLGAGIACESPFRQHDHAGFRASNQPGLVQCRRLFERVVCAATVAAALLVGGGASPASAKDSSALGCQATWATIYGVGGSAQGSWNCHGPHFTDVKASRLTAGGWSGAVYTSDKGTFWFCDWDSVDLKNANVYEVYLNETKPARCK
ncbi:hypothetical protein ACIBI9_56330, partial [Nonomuraea sp. NPDC050451]|uniref:hypothetical protein n=1 Tax=Nonomuraea sp. NPDC050451 TaxID=3364364 RepID=UPI0037B84D42